MNRVVNLNPSAQEVARIVYPPTHSRRRTILIEYLKFVPHSGEAMQCAG